MTSNSFKSVVAILVFWCCQRLGRGWVGRILGSSNSAPRCAWDPVLRGEATSMVVWFARWTSLVGKWARKFPLSSRTRRLCSFRHVFGRCRTSDQHLYHHVSDAWLRLHKTTWSNRRDDPRVTQCRLSPDEISYAGQPNTL